MLAFVQPTHLIRRAHTGETALIAHLRRASLWCLDLADHSLTREKDRLAYLRALDGFLAKYLGGPPR